MKMWDTCTSFDGDRYGATLFALKRNGEIKLNPGNEVKIEKTDSLFYICLTEEENAKIVAKTPNIQSTALLTNIKTGSLHYFSLIVFMTSLLHRSSKFEKSRVKRSHE